MVLFDHIRKTILVVAHAHLGPGGRPAGRLRRRLRPGRRAGRPPGRARPRAGRLTTSTPTARSTLEPESNFTREEYEAVVRHCQEYIKAGDIFQVVPSQRFQVETTAEPFDIYRVLRVVNPSPFLFYLPFGDFCLIGSSPEILVRVEDGTVTIRPLAGTRRRGKDEAEDRALAEELLADPKERAEHIMLVDLGRNDVGRVADFATRAAHRRDEGRALLARHAHHLERHRPARPRARPPSTPSAPACRPARSPGAPKVRAMQIIDEVEPQQARALRRGRRLHRLHRQHGHLHRPADPRPPGPDRLRPGRRRRRLRQRPGDEYEETVNKARGLLKAIEIAETQLDDGPRGEGRRMSGEGRGSPTEDRDIPDAVHGRRRDSGRRAIEPGRLLGEAWSIFSAAWPTCLVVYWGAFAAAWLIINLLVIVLASINVAIGDPAVTPLLEFLRFLGTLPGPGVALARPVHRLPEDRPARAGGAGRPLPRRPLPADGPARDRGLPRHRGRSLPARLRSRSRACSPWAAAIRSSRPSSSFSPRACTRRCRSVGSVLLVSMALMLVLVGLWYAAFFAVRVRLRPFCFLIVDRRAGVVDSLRMSMKLTRGRVATLLLVHLAQFTINLAGLLVCCLGLFVTLPLTSLVSAVTYDALAGDLPPVEITDEDDESSDLTTGSG